VFAQTAGELCVESVRRILGRFLRSWNGMNDERVVANTEHFIIFSMITNIYNKKTKGPTLMELFTATGRLKKFFFDN
jgi:hypothetical protein